MIITTNQEGYETKYVYGGANLFTPLASLASRLIGSTAAQTAQQAAKSAAEQIIKDVGKAAVQKTGEEAGKLVKNKIGQTLAGSPEMKTSSNVPIANKIYVDTPNNKISVSGLSSGLTGGLGIRKI